MLQLRKGPRLLQAPQPTAKDFILPHAFAVPPSARGVPCGHLPRTRRGQFGKQPCPEHRALLAGGHGIARGRSAPSASLKSQSPALTYRRAARAEQLLVHSTTLRKRSYLFPPIVEHRQRSSILLCRRPYPRSPTPCRVPVLL